MKNRIQSITKLVVLDTVGGIFLVAALLTGWLPGPGGIPLFLIGLSIISVNHESARRFKEWISKNSDRFLSFFFPHIWWVEWLYDTMLVLLLCGVGALIWLCHHPYRLTFATFLLGASLVITIGNRSRWHRFKAWAKAHRRQPKS